MKKLGLFLLFAAFIYACNSEAPSDSSQSSTPKAKAKKEEPKKKGPDGSKVYKQYCVVCHGVYGDMGASGAFDLTTSELSVEERINVITNGRNVMTAFKSILDEDKIKPVAEYTLTLKKEDK